MNEEELIKSAGPRPAASAERAARVRAGVHAEWQKRFRRRRYQQWSLSAAAAALLIATAVLILPRMNPGRVSVAAATLDVHTGTVRGLTDKQAFTGKSIESTDGRAAFRLIDGGSLRLDVDTQVTFTATRVIELTRGAVYFDSAGAASNVRIATSIGSVTDVGTQFEVRLSGDTMVVRVREGQVDMVKRRVSAGTEAQLGKNGAFSQRALAPHDPAWSWVLDVAPRFNLEGATLREFLNWTSRETGLTVRGNVPEDVVLHGSLEGLRPDQALDAVLPTTGFKGQIEDGTLVLEKGR